MSRHIRTPFVSTKCIHGKYPPEYIRAGVAGIHIEDQVAPKRCGFVQGKQLVSIEEAAGKYRAAVDAKNELDPDFVIIARCDARTRCRSTSISA